MKGAINSRKIAITKEEKRLVTAKSRLCKSFVLVHVLSYLFNANEMIFFSPRPEGAS